MLDGPKACPGVLSGWGFGRLEAACLEVHATRSLICCGKSAAGTASPSSSLSKLAMLQHNK